MPASPCHTYDDPEGLAAWKACNTAETALEKYLLDNPHVASFEIPSLGWTYFIDAGRMLSCGTHSDGTFDREEGIHRDHYEGLCAFELLNIADSVADAMASANIEERC